MLILGEVVFGPLFQALKDDFETNSFVYPFYTVAALAPAAACHVNRKRQQFTS